MAKKAKSKHIPPPTSIPGVMSFDTQTVGAEAHFSRPAICPSTPPVVQPVLAPTDIPQNQSQIIYQRAFGDRISIHGARAVDIGQSIGLSPESLVILALETISALRELGANSMTVRDVCTAAMNIICGWHPDQSQHRIFDKVADAIQFARLNEWSYVSSAQVNGDDRIELTEDGGLKLARHWRGFPRENASAYSRRQPAVELPGLPKQVPVVAEASGKPQLVSGKAMCSLPWLIDFLDLPMSENSIQKQDNTKPGYRNDDLIKLRERKLNAWHMQLRRKSVKPLLDSEGKEKLYDLALAVQVLFKKDPENMKKINDLLQKLGAK